MLVMACTAEAHHVLLPQEMYDAFKLHDESDLKKTSNNLRGWDVCDEMHDDEMGLDRTRVKQCLNTQQYTDVHYKASRSLLTQERSASAFSASKANRKGMKLNTSGVLIRRSKSSRCIPSATSSAPGLSPQRILSGKSPGSYSNNNLGYRAMSDPSLRHSTRYSSTCNEVHDITYDFRHYQRHQQHIDSYRKAYTYLLMRKFRELRASGYAGYKLQAALKLNISGPTLNKLHAEAKQALCLDHKELDSSVVSPEYNCTYQEFIEGIGSIEKEEKKLNQSPQDLRRRLNHKTLPKRRPPLTPPPVLYYSETCPTGPVVYNRKELQDGKSYSSKVALHSNEYLTNAAVCRSASELGPSKVSKIRNRIDNEDVQREGKVTKVLTKSRQNKSGRHFSDNSSALVVGNRAGKPVPSFVRKMSPMGRVPAPLRRASAAMREKRKTTVHAVDPSKYLSIAMASQTVTSPYCRKNEDCEDGMPTT